MSNLNLAYIQADLKWEDKTTNLQHFSELLEQVQPETDLIFLPETFTTAFPVDPKVFGETEAGPTMQWLREKAKAKNAVIATTFPLDKDGRYYNSLVWMRPDGSYELYFKRRYRIWFAKMPLPLMIVVCVLIIFVIYQFITADLQAFIYFQF